MGTVFGREPALAISLVAAIVQLLVAFGLDLTADQQTAISVATLAIVGFAVRSKVTPT
jgi:hypothetical protein